MIVSILSLYVCAFADSAHTKDKEIYLLDDPLAAVDADVAHHLMEKCILGILGTKTRILCTHRIEFLDRADVVVLMDNGTIVKIGEDLNGSSHVEEGFLYMWIM